jgi:hypothetical protein
VSREDVDALIRQLVSGDRVPSEQDAGDILGHIAGSTFYLGRRNIPRPLQELMREHGYLVPIRGDDLIYHWAKHVLGDGQWTPDTTPAEYWQHAEGAIRRPESSLVVQKAEPGHAIAIVVARTANVVPERNFGPRSGDELLVVYSATTGRILSAYMTETSSQFTARPSTIWLRR